MDRSQRYLSADTTSAADHSGDRWLRFIRVVFASTLLASTATVVGVGGAPSADAATITTFSTGALTCPNGTSALLAEWSGLTSTPTFPTSSVTAPYSLSLNTSKSGYPAGSIFANITRTTITGSAGDGFMGFFTPTGTGFASQYSVPSLELGHDSGGNDQYTLTLTFPAPTMFYFPILDVDSGERGSVTAMNGATPVLPTVTVRNPVETTVTNSGTTATFNNTNINGNNPDSDDRGMVEISSAVPVTSVTLVDVVPAGSNELGNVYGCQAQDIVKAGTTPTLVATTATTATYATTLTFKLGNTELAGNLRVYGPQITDSLSTIFGILPAWAIMQDNSIQSSFFVYRHSFFIAA